MASADFFHGCRKRYKRLRSDADGVTALTSAVFFIAVIKVKCGYFGGVSEMPLILLGDRV
jgi:hypothetical protein